MWIEIFANRLNIDIHEDDKLLLLSMLLYSIYQNKDIPYPC